MATFLADAGKARSSNKSHDPPPSQELAVSDLALPQAAGPHGVRLPGLDKALLFLPLLCLKVPANNYGFASSIQMLIWPRDAGGLRAGVLPACLISELDNTLWTESRTMPQVSFFIFSCRLIPFILLGSYSSSRRPCSYVATGGCNSLVILVQQRRDLVHTVSFVEALTPAPSHPQHVSWTCTTGYVSSSQVLQ